MSVMRHICYAIPCYATADKRLSSTALRLRLAMENQPPLSVPEMSKLVNRCVRTVRDYAERLIDAGWAVELDSDESGTRRIAASMPGHVEEFIAERISDGKWQVADAGQYLMLCVLDVGINSLSYLDNARPAFLRNVLTRRKMEYDRYYYAHKAAFEFNGPQHYRTTQRYPDPDQLAKQQARDNMKAGISVRQGITLVEVRAEDLSFDHVMRRAPANLPRRYVNPEGPLIQTVTSLCEEYVSYWIAKNAQGSAGDKDEG
ncbi:MAG TPA: hypothetical protein PLM74_01785 [Bacillota bacterium]|nr:hypothetical protein [Bacillota bacterium]